MLYCIVQCIGNYFTHDAKVRREKRAGTGKEGRETHKNKLSMRRLVVFVLSFFLISKNLN